MLCPEPQRSSKPVDTIERRRSYRYTVRVPIELRTNGTPLPFSAETTDLSLDGCYVRLAAPLSPGAYVDATLWMDDSPIHIRGRVVTRHPQFGNGIMFLSFQGDGDQFLASCLDAVVD